MTDFRGVFDKLSTIIRGSSRYGEHYQLSFNNSKMCFDTGNQLLQNTVISHFKDSYSLPWERGANKIYITLNTQNVSKLNINVKLPKANISREEIITRIEIKAPFLKRPKISSLFTLDKGLVLVKGLYLYVTNEANMDGWEHPYFGILSANKDKLLIEDNYALLRVLSIDGKYYFITHFQKPEACSRGLVIYRLEGDSLAEAFNYYEDNVKIMQ